MANHKSALKRAMQNEIRRMRNKTVKTSVKKVTKELRLSLNEDSGEMTLKKLNTAQSLIDKAAKKGVIHKKTAARKISRLSKLAVATAT
ncbi:MAG: 30S ribosomal protein S20 [Thermodesulfobacteriota bacterium]|nr:30S ribosomal protein S20 [Deltaproteobacteria bacterium]MEA1899379.1 30S ribosomal protein S20 [Thermodesulfobacteriota bacterium]